MLNEDLTLQYLEKILKVATIECKTYSTNTHIPKRAYQASAGHYLLAAETKVLRPCGRALIKLDLSMAISEGYYQ